MQPASIWTKDRPNQAAYFSRFPIQPSEAEDARASGKLLADIGLAHAQQDAIRQASEAVFAEALQSNRRIDWRNFADEVLRLSASS